MRTKLTILSAIAALLAVAATAFGAGPPVTVALYSFTTADDVNAFQQTSRGACAKKLKKQTMSIAPGKGTNSCVYRTSVLADSSDLRPDQLLQATVCLSACAAKTKKRSAKKRSATKTTANRSAQSAAISPKLAKQAYMGVGARQSDTAGYELRVLPGAHKWQFFRDPKGPAPAVLDGSGNGAFIKGGSKPNTISLQAFDAGSTTTQLIGRINGQPVVSKNDTAEDQPDGRRTTVSTGKKGTGAATGIVGVFDDVSVQVPSPF